MHVQQRGRVEILPQWLSGIGDKALEKGDRATRWCETKVTHPFLFKSAYVVLQNSFTSGSRSQM